MDAIRAAHRPEAQRPSRERGMALLLALFVLTGLTFISMFLASSTTVNRRMASDDVTRLKAARYAEAGVAEALNRIQNNLGPDPSAASPALKVVQILNTTTPGAAGTDTTLRATGQPAGSYLPYSTATKGSGALTITFETDAARTKVYLYDKTLNPPMQFTSGDSVYRITSTATVGSVTRRLVVNVTRPRVNGLALEGAVCSGVNIKYTGSGVDCGFNHRTTTPYPSGQAARTGAGGAALRREPRLRRPWARPRGRG